MCVTWPQALLELPEALVGQPSDVPHGQVSGRQDVEAAEGVGLAEGSRLLQEGSVGVLGGGEGGDEGGVVLRPVDEVVQEALRVVGEKGRFVRNCP